MKSVFGASLLPLALAAPSWSSWPVSKSVPEPNGASAGSSPSAYAYFLDNNVQGSSIVSLTIDSNGLLGNPIKTSSGGKGSHMVNGTGSPVRTDALGSQNAVVIDGNLLFTVNAGSDTLALFSINASNPQHPHLINTAPTLGEFPISVAYSSKLKKACVLNGGAKAGVTCFNVDPVKGLSADGGLRAFSTSYYNNTTPPSGPPGSAAQVSFNPDSSALFATVKGLPPSGSTPAKLGSVLAWPVQNGEVSTAAPVISQFSNVILDFGFQFISQTEILLTDPAFGAALLEVQPNLTATQKAHTVIPGEAAVCWTAYYPPYDLLYVFDSGVNQIYTLNATTGARVGQIDITSPTPGAYDDFLLNEKIYTISDSNAILVVDIVKQQQIQYLNLTSFGNRPDYQGLAYWQ